MNCSASPGLMARAPLPALIAAMVSLLLTAAIFGFFYAYSVSAIWGLNDAEPRAAIAAMQGINRVVRNAAFAPAFFGTPCALALTALFAWLSHRRSSAMWFALAAIVYLIGGLALTFAFNVPMNEALAAQTIPSNTGEAQTLWRGYAGPWLFWNHVRMAFSGVALLLAGAGLLSLGRERD